MTASKSRPARLAAGLFFRGDVIWARYKNASGKWESTSLKLRAGDERAAAELLSEMKRQVAVGQELGLNVADGQPTFERFFRWWIDRRQALRLRAWKDDESRIRTHVLSQLGPMRLDAITPLDLERVFTRMRDIAKAPKTVWNTYSSVRALFRDAVKKGFLRQTPCVLGVEELGPMVDKDPEWRETAIYSRDEIGGLLFDERVPVDRRVFYAITYLAGRRLGETSGLRLRHLTLDDTPLGGIVFARSYAQDRTKTNSTVRMPIHPLLDEVLRWWLSTGFREMFGRDPQPDDFVVPRPPECRSRFGASRDKNYVRKQLLKDLDALELRQRRTHDLRRSFISHAQQDGGQPHLLIRLTHPSTKKATAFAGYTEFAWEDLCAEVAKLRVDVPEPALQRIQIVAVGDDEGPRDPDHDPNSGGGRLRTLPLQPTQTRVRPRLATLLATPEKKPQGSPGVREWRRRESNPGPVA